MEVVSVRINVVLFKVSELILRMMLQVVSLLMFKAIDCLLIISSSVGGGLSSNLYSSEILVLSKGLGITLAGDPLKPTTKKFWALIALLS